MSLWGTAAPAPVWVVLLGLVVGAALGIMLGRQWTERPAPHAWPAHEVLLRWQQRPPGAWAEGLLPGLSVMLGHLMPLVVLLPVAGWLRGPAPAAPLLALALVPPGLWIGANLQYIRGRRGPREVTILPTGIVNGQFYFPWSLIGHWSDGPAGLVRLHAPVPPYTTLDGLRPPDAATRAALVGILHARGRSRQPAGPALFRASTAAWVLRLLLVPAAAGVGVLLVPWLPGILQAALVGLGTLTLMRIHAELIERMLGVQLPRRPDEPIRAQPPDITPV